MKALLDIFFAPTAGRRATSLHRTWSNQGPDRANRRLDATSAYWFCMFAASALGTNLGDFWVDELSLNRTTSFASLAAISGLAIWSDSRADRRTEVGYWVAIVALRAAATNVADFLTHDLALGYVASSIILLMTTLIAGRFTRPDAAKTGIPSVDGRYWIAMLIAGIFGTVGGDLASHTIGLYAAAGVLCGLLVAVLVLRGRWAPASVMAYWLVVLAERCAGTPVGDALASHHAVGLGLKLAMACTGGLLLAALLFRALLAGWGDLRQTVKPT